MGRVRTKTVKKAARVIIEKYYTKLTLDFDTNKRIIEEVAVIPSKPLRSKVYNVTSIVSHDDKTSLHQLCMTRDYKKERPTDPLFLSQKLLFKKCLCGARLKPPKTNSK